jgi:hypothetical protein
MLALMVDVPPDPGSPPSDEDRLDAIRAHADSTMRYYATAYLREQEEDARQLMSAHMAITANVIALIEEDLLDDRGMLEGREQVIHRYIAQARTDPWEPGTCSFCGERPVVAWFEGPHFATFVRSSTEVRAEEAWLSCATCLALVERDDRDGLSRRGADRLRGRSTNGIDDDTAVGFARRHQDELFWRPRERT